MKKSILATGILLTSPATMIASPIIGHIAQAQSPIQNPGDLFTSDPISVNYLGLSRKIRIGIRVHRNTSSHGTPCGREPEYVELEILDDVSFHKLKRDSRYFVDLTDGSSDLKYPSSSFSCQSSGLNVKFTNQTRNELRLTFKQPKRGKWNRWDKEKGLYINGIGWVKISNGAKLKLVK